RILFIILLDPHLSPLFPYTTLFRSIVYFFRAISYSCNVIRTFFNDALNRTTLSLVQTIFFFGRACFFLVTDIVSCQKQNRNKEKDRKSTRLNSSHVKRSYAVFCLKQ